MSGDQRRIHLGVLINGTGFHIAGWRHPSVKPDRSLDIRYYADLAQIAERGKFDVLFLADGAAVNYASNLEATKRIAPPHHLEPFTLLSALAVLTSRIGLVGSVSTTYNEPYHVARRFASLDHISNGRAAWNIVTSDNPREALNFSRSEHVEHDERYRRAHEFTQVVTGLWDSWDDDALVLDQQSGIYFDVQKVHALDHVGERFSVKGPLNVFRSPQGHPVIMQAGSSKAGRDFAATHAEVIFTAQQSIEDARAFYADVKERARILSRSQTSPRILAGIVPFVGNTREEAQAKFNQLRDLIPPEVGLQLLSELFGGLDLSSYPVDGPLPDIPASNAGHGRRELLIDLAREKGYTIRDLYLHAAGSRGHRVIIGSAAEIADDLQHWFETGAADGFALMPPFLPLALAEFVDAVVPELQRRGLFRHDYEGVTLRENLGLRRPDLVRG